MDNADIGVYGLGVMGNNLAQNLQRNGYRVAVYNHPLPGEDADIVSNFLDTHSSKDSFTGTFTEEELIKSLNPPRKILLMVTGRAVDEVLSRLAPLLDTGDIIMDGGNSHFEETARRLKKLDEKGIHYLGIGISGGQEGALNGPSLMAGGSGKAWDKVKPILNDIAAPDPDGVPCCGWMGDAGAGHFIKMVHNGIEYADMQLIAEMYHLMKSILSMDNEAIADVFEKWNGGDLGSYLTEITADILRFKDKDGLPLLSSILDAAGQKGTGRWAAISALQEGVPLPSITSSVQARVYSSLKNLRTHLSRQYNKPTTRGGINENIADLISQCEKALLASRLMVLAEGFHLVQQTAKDRGWDTVPAEVARVWKNGCIIRSALLEPVHDIFKSNPETEHLLKSDYYSQLLNKTHHALRKTVTLAIQNGIPCPAMSNALSSYDLLGTERLPANLIQAQRDYFGAHQYERIDRPRGTFFHTGWTNTHSTGDNN